MLELKIITSWKFYKTRSISSLALKSTLWGELVLLKKQYERNAV